MKLLKEMLRCPKNAMGARTIDGLIMFDISSESKPAGKGAAFRL
jgi:hypothetical protein